MEKTFSSLLKRMQELKDLDALGGLASWDQETFMPSKAHHSRGDMLTTLQGIRHERLVDPALGELLEGGLASTADEKAMVRVLKHERDRAVKLPKQLVEAIAQQQSKALSSWKAAREQKSFKVFQPELARLVALRQEQADLLGHGGERYDALLDSYEPSMKVERLAPVLTALKNKLTPLVDQITSRPPPKDVLGGKKFSSARQLPFTLEVLKAMRFDLEAGRQDESIHPFTQGMHPHDVRLTTRVNDSTPLPAIFGTIHECGHGLYEQGYPVELARTPLAQAPSMGIHESQSRLWENVVGRSKPFWTFFWPKLQAAFPAELGAVGIDDWLAEVNRVRRTFIRVEADEVTYNLHIVLRFELELGMLRGSIPIANLEEAWNAKTKELLGLDVKSPLEGVLQDIHWAFGDIGYFPTYTLGNLYSASLWSAAKRDLKGLEASIAAGELKPLLDWLRAKVHGNGYRFSAEETITKATGRGLTDEDFIGYLKEKYAL